MSGGHWGYQSWRIEELAEEIKSGSERLSEFIKAVAESERIIDWAESGDTVRRRPDGSGAERELYELWLATFNRVYGENR